MANGKETMEAIRELLKDDKTITPQMANRLILSAIADLTDTFKEFTVDEAQRHLKIDTDITELKKRNILLWIKDNKPVAFLLGTLSFIVILVAPDIIIKLVAKFFGVAP